MKNFKHYWPHRALLLIALVISIPAFYLILAGPNAHYRDAGAILYGVMAVIIAIDLGFHIKRTKNPFSLLHAFPLDVSIFIGALASTWLSGANWSPLEWLLRLGFCGIVFLRLSMLLTKWLKRRRLVQILTISTGLLAIAGGGFYWLDPKVLTYADGLWLAFTTGATVGYGDIIPSTPASRIFAVFIVLLGYAVFSVVTASIAALFVGEDEKRFERELHADIRSLREEISALRNELRGSSS